MDLTQTISGFSSVDTVDDIKYPEKTVLNFLFFLCPRLTGDGIIINRRDTGFTATYRSGLSKSALERIGLVRKFAKESMQAGIKFTTTAIFAAADAITLFVPPPQTPQTPCVPDIKIRSNLMPVRKAMGRWRELYTKRPWEQARDVDYHMYPYEKARLMQLLPQAHWARLDDFVNRTLANFALDGVLMGEGVWGENPIILGVESPGVAVLQNTVVKEKKRIPVIQFCAKLDDEVLKNLPQGSGGH
ncbi:MAG: hypothetical protein Q7S86_03240 [bacterium]|nr:hypothetical protein [bacterium]